MNIIEAMLDARLFRPWFRDRASWRAWESFLAALFALPMTAEEEATYRASTGRARPPQQPFRETWLVCGRRAGKSFILALVAVFLACFRSYGQFLAPGERATVRQLLSGIESDLGGADLLSVGQRQLAQRAALHGALPEDAEARWAAGESIDIDPYLRAVGVQRRVLATLGLERRARDVTPSEDLQSYLSARRRVAEAAGEPLEVRSPVDFDEIAGEPRP